MPLEGTVANHFELVVVTSSDGYIARYSGEDISRWTSPEENARFVSSFEGIDWGIMGRVTHEQIFKRERRRIVFSTTAETPEWREPTHLWVDPNRCGLDEIMAIVSSKHPAGRNLILGGTGVHDWFLEQGRIDRVQLAIEPVTFDGGVPLFSHMAGCEPLDCLQDHGFRLVSSELLNEKGSYWHILQKQPETDPS